VEIRIKKCGENSKRKIPNASHVMTMFKYELNEHAVHNDCDANVRDEKGGKLTGSANSSHASSRSAAVNSQLQIR
jgi:hypothetical protein